MQITLGQIRKAREALLPPGSISTYEECRAAVSAVGMVWPFTPGNELLPALFPALHAESDGKRWDMMWGWKDRFAASRDAYYGKVVGSKPTLVSHEWLAVLYALTGNTGDLDDDLTALGERVRLQDLAIKTIQYLREYGPTDTRTLQQKLTDGTREMRRAADRALDQLDEAMLIVKSGTQGGNSIANIWELFPRYYPEVVDAGTEIPTREAALRLLERFFVLTPAVRVQDLRKVFPWHEGHQQKAIVRLKESGALCECTFEGKPGLCAAGLGTAG
ncbi:MAG TPA: crosslink repair DNA glycosylase YcaQ family protein [Symbiobacteriaceae bacterium]|nr:crosslink repair DNA glycosylase YcaQ family protein [Symbiobacteriaceae bacterium]